MTKRLIILALVVFFSSAGWSGLNEDLFEAVKKVDKKKVSALIQKRADINAKTKHGKTPLDLAESDEMKIILREAGGKSGKNLK